MTFDIIVLKNEKLFFDVNFYIDRRWRSQFLCFIVNNLALIYVQTFPSIKCYKAKMNKTFQKPNIGYIGKKITYQLASWIFCIQDALDFKRLHFSTHSYNIA